jgi:excisionase family DNA binding protein
VIDVASVAETPRLRDISEAAAYLNVPYSWLRDKVTERRVPFTRLGKHVRFTEDHLDQIVAAGEQPVAPSPARGRRRRRSPSRPSTTGRDEASRQRRRGP